LNISAKYYQNSELYRFKVGAFFETQCMLLCLRGYYTLLI